MPPVDQLTTIKNEVLIQAPRTRVWKALTTVSEFSEWFGVKSDAQEFQIGHRVNMVCTIPGYEGEKFFVQVVEKTPQSRFAWQWHPGGKEAGPPAPDDPFTTVVFELEEVPGGTLVKVTESGFDRISLARRAKAFEQNTEGWEYQMKAIRNYVEQSA